MPENICRQMNQEIANTKSENVGRPQLIGDPVFISHSISKPLLAGIAALLFAAAVAVVIHRINAEWAEQPEKAVQIVAGLFAVLAVLPLGFYLNSQRSAAKLSKLGLIILGTIGTLLVGCYFFWASFYIMYPGDFLVWSESDFVNDILKFRQGYPIFTQQINNESFTYVPGTQLLTYFLAWIVGQPTSIPVYRGIQVFYTFLSVVVAFLSCRRLIGFGSEQKISDSPWWGVVGLTGLFLIATNTLTNPFTHLLHNDALAQLVNVTAYWLLLEYETTKNKRILWLMALIPVVGFWVKQSLIIWVVLYSGYFAIFERPRSFKRLSYFALTAGGGVLVAFLLGYALWKDDFIYWAFTVLGKHGVSPLRSFEHLLNIWVYFVIGLFGGMILLRGDRFKLLFGHWMIWLLLITTETYTSGVAWMLNHIGPGCLIAGIWFLAALACVWTKIPDLSIQTSCGTDWLRAGAAAAILCLLFSGLGAVRVPVPPLGDDAGRYAREIEAEFDGEQRARTLLDFGSWVYLPDGVVMKDRAPTIGERGWSQTGDFSGILNRLEQKYYTKILVRNLHSPDFWYDSEVWNRSSGIRNSLLENYREIRIIKAVKGLKMTQLPYGFNEISVLVPRAN
jgi:hypothetical protein